MSENLLILPVLLPLAGGGALFAIQPGPRMRKIYTEVIVLLTSLSIFLLLAAPPDEGLLLFHFTGNLNLTLRLDGMGMLFAGLIAILWPLATLYSFEYMAHEARQNGFFAFYTMTYGVTVGIAFAGNLLTLYMFYELLTLVTVPLVMHSLNKQAVRASRKYLYYSLGGAAFAFIGLVFLMVHGATLDFQPGGSLTETTMTIGRDQMLLIYVMTALGFSVKAASFPFHGWLPTASVAPTPVTALLHAVAVVKSGAFAVLRLTYFSFGTSFLQHSWAQMVTMSVAMITILYASTRAVRELHFKRRLAYSTISNLSYILLAGSLMTPLGLAAALCHMITHAFMKICSFFCAGAVMHQTGRNYIYELDGLGRKMPVTFACFTVASLSLFGVPPLAGFISKWSIAEAAFSAQLPLSMASVAVLLYSALMTAIYMMTVVVRAWFVPPDAAADQIHDPNWYMKLPLVLYALALPLLGLFAAPLLNLLGALTAAV